VRTTTAGLALLAALLACGACRRPDLQADGRIEAEIAGAWVRPARQGPGVEGFDLRPGGRLAVLNAPGLSGVAWNVSRGELVVSSRSERAREPIASRLRIERPDAETLELASHEADFFAGRYRRARAVHVAGVLTYLEARELPTDAEIELALRRGDRLVAHVRSRARGPVPLPFELAYLPEPGASELALVASISASGETLFATPDPVAVRAGADAKQLEVVLAPAAGRLGP
jgi:uncharacterized lipoprotein YbaY